MARSEDFWRILTMHCDEASRLASEMLDHPLDGVDRLACQLHLLICRDCRRHRREILAIREFGREMTEAAERPGVALTDEARERIKQALHGDNSTG